MSTPVSTVRKLGPAFEQACQRAGIGSAEAMRALDPNAAYTKLLQSGPPTAFHWLLRSGDGVARAAVERLQRRKEISAAGAF